MRAAATGDLMLLPATTRGRGGVYCPITGLPPLVVYDPVPVAGELPQAAVNVLGLEFVFVEVSDVIIDGDGVSHEGRTLRSAWPRELHTSVAHAST